MLFGAQMAVLAVLPPRAPSSADAKSQVVHLRSFPFVWVRTCLVMFALRSLMYLQLPQAQVKRFFCPDFDMSRPPRWTQRVFRLLTPREPLRRARGAEFGR